jgi:hypothetical protein
MIVIEHEGHRLAVLVDGDDPLPCHWSQTRVTTARVNELWCDTPAVAVQDGIACCRPHLPDEGFAAAVDAARTATRLGAVGVAC